LSVAKEDNSPIFLTGNGQLATDNLLLPSEDPMIALTRLNGQQFVMNAEKIRYIEATPDTVVCCDTGEKLMVKETLDEVMRRAIDYARIIRKVVTE
jgi:flagellar protein FlbD